MEGECKILSGNKPESDLEDKRKLKFTKKCFCYEDGFSSKKKRSIDNRTYSHLSKSNFCMAKNYGKFNATTLKFIKPCSVKLSPLDPKLCAFFEGSMPKNFRNENFNDKQNGSLIPVKSIGIQKKKKSKSSTSDFRKILKPCSVILEKISLNYFSKDLEINFPAPLCSTGRVKLKPCSVKLHRINTNEVDISKLDIINGIKPCIFKPVEITSEVLSVIDKKQDDLNVAPSDEIFKLVTSSKNLDLNLILEEEKSCSQSDCEEIYPHITVTTNVFNQHKNTNIEDDSQNLFEVCSLKSNGAKSVIKVSDTQPNVLNSLKNEKLSVITKLVKNSNFANEKYPVSDPYDSYTRKVSEVTLTPFSPLCNSYSEKASRSLKSFEILKDKTVSAGNRIKYNEPSSFKFAVKSYSKDDKGQCQMKTSENCVHQCFHCSKSLPSLKSLYYHLCREKQKRGYPCKFCEKNFDFYRALKKHKKCHALRNSLSCSDTMKRRQRDRRIGRANCVLELKNKVDIKVLNTPSKTISGSVNNNEEKGLEGKENNSFTKLKPKKLKTKFFLQSISDATTSSGCYSSDNSNFLHYVWNSDDSEVD